MSGVREKLLFEHSYGRPKPTLNSYRRLLTNSKLNLKDKWEVNRQRGLRKVRRKLCQVLEFWKGKEHGSTGSQSVGWGMARDQVGPCMERKGNTRRILTG